MNTARLWYQRLLRRRVVTEGIWVTIGQGFSALGTLVGIRILTRLLPPTTYGLVSLLLGAGTLISGIFCTPFIQAMLRYYPQYASTNRIIALRRAVDSAIRRGAALGILLLAVLGVVYWKMEGVAPVSIGLLAALVLVDTTRSREIAFYNAARRQKPYALWTAAESWTRPLLAASAVYYFRPTSEPVLAGYLSASFLLLVLIPRIARREGINGQHDSTELDPGLNQMLLSYALPLMPLAVLGWISGVGDRYIIADLIGLKEAGIYAAAYGLVSRPFLMAGQAIELTLRPHYQNAIAANDGARAAHLLRAWKILLLLIMTVAFSVIALWHQQIAWLLLGAKYQSGARLMPWIAGGYGLLTLSHFYERQCYAHSKTHYVLITQVFGGIASFLISLVAVIFWGLIGAAVAVPVYFGIQLAMSRLLASRITTEING